MEIAKLEMIYYLGKAQIQHISKLYAIHMTVRVQFRKYFELVHFVNIYIYIYNKKGYELERIK